MIFFCDSGGNIFNVIPSRIYQGSAGANTIRFVGQFPSSSQVLVAYKLPNGIATNPKYMSYVDELEEVQAPNGGKYSVWESVIGATPKYDDQNEPITDAQGNQEYKLDYAVTETPGEVMVQFYVYGPMQQGGVPGARLATASSSFTVEKGVPVILEVPPSEETAVEELLTLILTALNTEAANIDNLETWQEQAGQDIDNLETDVGLNASRISTLSNEVEGLDGSVSGLRVSVNGLYDWAFGVNGTPTAPSVGSATFNIEALDASVSILQNNVGNLNNTVIPAINARIDLQEQVIKQSGLQYSQDITQEYQTRETANGENVLNGSKAILKTVVGSTVATSNQLNASLINNSSIEVSDDGKTITLVVTGGGAGPSNFGIGKLKDLCPYLHIGDSVYLYGTGAITGLCNSLFNNLLPFNSSTPTVLTDEILNTDLFINCGTITSSITITDLQITKVQNAPWYPFFYGLKSAGFSGFTSSKADSTSPNGFNFSFEQMPLGKTIDFENKKFVDYGITAELDGTEDWSYYPANLWTSVAPSALIVGFLPASASNLQANAASTDGYLEVKYNGTLPKGNFVIGNGSQNLWWFGCFNYLGIDSNWADKNNPTPAEQTAAIAALKAYLAQRKAAGNPVTIRYVMPTVQTETPFNSAQEEAGNSYTAYLGGVETVNGNSDAEYGAENTLTQNYVLIKEV